MIGKNTVTLLAVLATTITSVGYAAAIVVSHRIDTRNITLSQAKNWASAEAGTMLQLVDRELQGAGISTDLPDWHPKARLVGVPAWQNGIISALSDNSALMAELAPDRNGRADTDLGAASRLLLPKASVLAKPRLVAATEALRSYDGRLMRGLATAATDSQAVTARLDTYTHWADSLQEGLNETTGQTDGWPAAEADIEAIYRARAYAHVVSQLLLALEQDEPGLFQNIAHSYALEQTVIAWRQAATFNPLIISNPDGNGMFLSDHPARMAELIARASNKTVLLSDTLNDQNGRPISTASNSLAISVNLK